ncbi:MAG: alpha-amylase [Phaeodactylibacter sp.]|nr:alpha-amylase [Phaeodactylibacter sp.]
MKNHTSLFFTAAILAAACNSRPIPAENAAASISFPEKTAPGTIYEVNIRQHTPEGTLNAFIKDLPRLKGMGVQMLWIMPVQPIGIENRKGTLGSYYAVRDYTAVNEEFGTLDDFNNLVDNAHELGLSVILDWVPNHTAWDHPWTKAHPEYYAKDSLGNIIYEADWTDIALLDHTNPATRAAMIQAMKFWVDSTAIDGFRCDHAGHEIPLYFWEEATAALDSIRDLFWLAEWDEARMHLEFDATYAWGLMHLTNEVAKGKANADSLHHWIMNDLHQYGQKAFRMTIITNHDENAWQGTVFERYGEGHQTFATFIFTAYGIPMLYSGQEAGLDKRLRFFDKDTIDWSGPGGLQLFYQKLVALKADNPALWAGEYGAMPQRINADPDIYGFKRVKGDNTVIGILNFSGERQEFHLTDASVSGVYNDYFTGQEYELSAGRPLEMEPWEYWVFAGK